MRSEGSNREVREGSVVRRSAALDALRGVLTLLVVAHHAALAYHPWAPAPAASLLAESRFWMAFPIVDPARAAGLDLFVGWNDVWFMSLFFLVAGAVAWPSLRRKGAGAYFRDRLRRLGIPFLIGAGLLAPLAYLPTYLLAVRQNPQQPGTFVRQWLDLGSWPAGPAWFLWVLLAFSGAAALAFRWAPGWGTAAGRLTGRLSRQPALFCLALVAVSMVAYQPLAAHFRPETWSHFGPFFLQTSRALHYAVYFAVGAGLGAWGLDRGLLDPRERLARRWPLWAAAAVLSFALAIAALLTILGTSSQGGPSPLLLAGGNLSFVVCCAATSLAVLGFFVRRAHHSPGWLVSLSANALGIYLLHYACVSWLQLLLLPAALPGIVKALLVFTGAVAASWALTAALRRIPAARKVL